MDLLRAPLLKIEELPYKAGHHFSGIIEIPGHSADEVYYHALLAQDEKLIEAKFLKGEPAFAVERLTYQGHEFLDLAEMTLAGITQKRK